jgi:hypothetical protein
MLSARKAFLQEQCRIREQKLNEDFSYFRENAGSILLFGLSQFIAPGRGTGKPRSVPPAKAGVAPSLSSVFNRVDMLSTTKVLGSVIWEIAQPLLVTWGINRIKQWLFKPKKRRKS